MADAMTCGRCGRQVEPLSAPPMPGDIGATIQARVCPACWAEWQGMEVMVINELKLNFMDPGAQRVLDKHMREFLALPPVDDEAP